MIGARLVDRFREHPADEGAVVLRPVPTTKPGQAAACSMSLLVAGFLLTRGFIGFNPGRPLFVLLGVGLAVSATIGLATDHVAVQASREHPADLLADELARSRRYGHPLTLVSLHCTPETGRRVVARLRGCDRGWRQGGDLRVLLTESDRRSLPGFLERVADLVDPGAVRAAAFPDDAITATGLVRALAPVVPTAAVHPEPTGVDGLLDAAPADGAPTDGAAERSEGPPLRFVDHQQRADGGRPDHHLHARHDARARRSGPS